MDKEKRAAIQSIVDFEIKKFADGYETRFTNEVNDPEGVINSKRITVLSLNLVRSLCFIVHLSEALTALLAKYWKR